jgi:hypothetical protein
LFTPPDDRTGLIDPGRLPNCDVPRPHAVFLTGGVMLGAMQRRTSGSLIAADAQPTPGPPVFQRVNSAWPGRRIKDGPDKSSTKSRLQNRKAPADQTRAARDEGAIASHSARRPHQGDIWIVNHRVPARNFAGTVSSGRLTIERAERADIGTVADEGAEAVLRRREDADEEIGTR